MAALHTLAALHAMQGRFELARELAQASRRIADELGPNRFAAYCSQFLAAVELLAGDPAAAEARLRCGYAILERMGERGLRSELAAGLCRALWAEGREEEAMRFGRLSGDWPSVTTCTRRSSEVARRPGCWRSGERSRRPSGWPAKRYRWPSRPT